MSLQELARTLLSNTYYNYPDVHTKDSAERISNYWQTIMQFSITKLQLQSEIQNMNEIDADIYVLNKILEKITVFENNNADSDVQTHVTISNTLIISPIKIYSVCSHHYAPMFGYVVLVLDISNASYILGLSKYIRIVKLYAKQPIVQELYTQKLAKILQKILQIDNLAVITKMRHLCMERRGVETELSVATSIAEIGNIDKTVLQFALNGIQNLTP